MFCLEAAVLAIGQCLCFWGDVYWKEVYLSMMRRSGYIPPVTLQCLSLSQGKSIGPNWQLNNKRSLGVWLSLQSN